MEYETTYYGRKVVITINWSPDGWQSKAELLESGQRVPLWPGSAAGYPTEEEARRAALSGAAEAIDRGRTARGKP